MVLCVYVFSIYIYMKKNEDVKNVLKRKRDKSSARKERETYLINRDKSIKDLSKQ